MDSFLQRMREELVRRNYAQNTIRSYLRIVTWFQAHCGKRLDHLGPDDLRSYHAYLLEERKLAGACRSSTESSAWHGETGCWQNRSAGRLLPV